MPPTVRNRSGAALGADRETGSVHPIRRLSSHVRTMGEHLDWHGSLFFEYFFDPETKQAQFIECNPRIGEAYNAFLSGVNLCEYQVRISLGEQVETHDAPTRTGVHSHSDFFVLLALAAAGASRRTILSEAWDMLRRRNDYQNSTPEITRCSEDVLSIIPATATFARLMLNPRSAQRIVNKTVHSYSLPQYGVENIHALSHEALQECLA